MLCRSTLDRQAFTPLASHYRGHRRDRAGRRRVRTPMLTTAIGRAAPGEWSRGYVGSVGGLVCGRISRRTRRQSRGRVPLINDDNVAGLGTGDAIAYPLNIAYSK